MKITLGLNSHHADSSACLFLNNELIFAIEEERINRVKHWAGLPTESIKACLSFCKLNLADVTHITINSNPKSNLIQKSIFFLKNYIFGKKKFEILKRLKNKFNLKHEIEKKLNEKFNKKLKIHYVDHHLSHLASAYFPSGFSEAAGLSIDGFGDFCSLVIAHCKNNKIKIYKKLFFPHSLGLLYEAFTQLIGFNKYGEEYKMMGLSCYGAPQYFDIIKKKIFSDYYNKKLNLDHFRHIDKNFVYNFSGEPNQQKIFKNHVISFFTENDTFSMEEIKNISSSIQKIYEEQLLDILKYIKHNISSDNLIFSGGCALNSLANKVIIDSNLFKNLYIPYAPGDGGGSIGSALFMLKDYFNEFHNLKNPFLGNHFTNEQIEEHLRNIDKKLFKIEKFTEKNLLNKKIALDLAENKVVGYFSGKMEFGARALGNRSILANPGNPSMKEILNLKIKRRENFRPFAPSILIDHKQEWFGNSRLNLYMSNVESIIENKRNIIPAVTHFDGTGRVQTVSKDINANFYNLIYEFYKITGIPILLNTSFNENEPIVNKPEHAIQCFLRTKMDILVLEDYVISRK